MRHYTSRAGDPHRHLHLQINARVFAAGGVAWAALGRRARQHRGDQRDRARRGDVRPGVPGGARRARLHPRRRDRRDRRAGAVRRGVQRAGRADRAATSTATRPSGAASIPARSPGRRCGGRGTGGRGRRPDPTRSCPPTAPSCGSGGSRSCASSATSPRRGRRQRRGVSRPGGSGPRRAWSRLVLDPARGAAVGVERRRRPRRGRAAHRRSRRGRRRRRARRAGRGPHRPRRRRVRPLLGRDDVPEHVRALTSPAGARGRATRLVDPDRPTRADAGDRSPWSRAPAGAGQDHHARPPPASAGRRRSGAADGGGHPDPEGRPGRRRRGRRRRRTRRPGWSTSTATAGTTDGRWTRVGAGARRRRPAATGDLLLVDEAGMLDQDTARALLTSPTRPAPASRSSVTGTSSPPSAAAASSTSPPGAHPSAWSSLEGVHRFTDPEYADLTLRMRTW